MKHSQSLPLLIILLICLPVADVFAQLGARNQRRSSDRSYDKYDIDRFIKDQKDKKNKGSKDDTTTIVERLKTTPEELRKLGASEELIEQLTQYNELQDSLEMVREEFERKKLEELYGKEYFDTLSIDDIDQIIEYQKEELIQRTLSLPESLIFGHEFFRRSNLKLYDEAELDIHPSENYVLGKGDELSIALWGPDLEQTDVYNIDETGSITPPIVGRVYLKGLTYSEAKKLIREKFARTYDFETNQIAISLNYSRIVSAHFMGELLNPGSYKVPSLTSIFNALVAIDGPNQLGSVRNIHIRRDGKLLKTLDVYDYLNDPSADHDFFLEQNDQIIVPPLGIVVNLSGEVRRPHNYELVEGEGLQDLIKYAGGLNAEAFTKTINIRRYNNNEEVLLAVDYQQMRAEDKRFPLMNGDSVFVYRVPLKLRNYVEVVGAVTAPGRYELREGEKISDILAKTQGVLEEADLQKAYVKRLKNDMSKEIISFEVEKVLLDPFSNQNITLQNLDTVQIISRETRRQDFYVRISGAVHETGDYEYAEGLNLSDLLFLSGGMRREAANNRIEVARVVNFSEEKRGENPNDRIIIKRIDVGKLLDMSDDAEDFLLQPYDHVFVRVAADFEEQQTVKLYGEIEYPGDYPLKSKEERVSDVIERAGGITPYASEEAARLYRLQDSTGFIILDLTEIFSQKGSRFDYFLTDEDSIYIPPVKNVVTLKGAIAHFDLEDTLMQISVPHEDGKNARYYINKYGGGFGKHAKRKRTYVYKPNGNILRAKNYVFFNQYPEVDKGSTIVVDITTRKKNEKERLERKKQRNWSEAFDTATTKVVAISSTILTILLLVRQAATQ